MKKAFRKPLLPLLFACLLVCGVALLLLLSENIAGNRRTVEQMYDDARIQFRVLPGMASAAELALPVKKAQGLLDRAFRHRSARSGSARSRSARRRMGFSYSRPPAARTIRPCWRKTTS